MLADPAEPGFFRQRLLQYRSAVAESAVLEPTGACLDPFGQLLQTAAHHLVVVSAQGIAGDESERRVAQDRRSIGSLAREVVEARGNHAQRAGLQFLRAAAARAVGLQKKDGTRQPGGQAGEKG